MPLKKNTKQKEVIGKTFSKTALNIEKTAISKPCASICYNFHMATSPSTVEYLMEQIANAGFVRCKKMFGEYAVYCNEKVVALVCDDKLFLKPTEGGREFIGEVEEAPPYSGAKPYFHINGDLWENSDWLTHLITITAHELPVPHTKKKKPRFPHK